ncbi:hypothetical protein VP1G_04705 [Cytospora mali]|uniref:Uncharacterized protein n=1 Tax=Cytospora mali TaxID=578113 RepID=A0A194V0B1_CYTMA|nr:hypothetical protein VP1G_04705 [Valsa mali var. pyri (nom. inval.)]
MSDDNVPNVSLESPDTEDDDHVDIFNIGLFEGGSEGSGFHIKKQPEKPLPAPRNSDYWASILVLRFRFDPQKRARRIAEATIELSFDVTDPDNEMPVVEAISFDGNYSFLPSKQTDTITKGHQGTLGASQVVDISATTKWEKTVTRETSDKTTVSGGKLVVDNIPPNRIAKWTLLENKTLKSGLPASIQVAVLVKRGDEAVFTCMPTISCKADNWTSIESLFSRVPEDDPLLLKPNRRPTNKLMTYDTENLGGVDLQKLSAVVPTIMILAAERNGKNKQK